MMLSKKLGSFLTMAFMAAGTMGSAHAAEFLDISKTAASCTKSSSLVGKTFALTSRAHAVQGDVTVVDDCTLLISNFNYDGNGLQVEVYSAESGSFLNGRSLSTDLLRKGNPYKNASLLLRLPSTLSIADIDGVSIWCSDAAVSFGDVLFN